MIDNAVFYKIGFVVPDLNGTARRMNTLHNMDWRDLGEVPPYKYWFPSGPEEHSLRTLVSGTTPRIHLFQEKPGTIWTSAANGAAHHIAYWVDDIAKATKKMLDKGFAIESRDAEDSLEPKHWAYFIDDSGVRVELLDRFGAEQPDSFISNIPVWQPK